MAEPPVPSTIIRETQGQELMRVVCTGCIIIVVVWAGEPFVDGNPQSNET